MSSTEPRRRSTGPVRPALLIALVLGGTCLAAQCNPGGGPGVADASAGAGGTDAGTAGAPPTAGTAGTGGAGGASATGGSGAIDAGDASAGTGGTAGSDGGTDGSAGAGGIAGGTGGTAGTSGSGGTGGTPPTSTFCGDGIRDPVKEECDDGTSADSCSSGCEVQDIVVGPPMPLSDAGAVTGGRRLGTGRHPVAGGAGGFAVAEVREEQAGVTLTLSTFDANGTPVQQAIDVGAGTTPILDANPVVAALGGGTYAVAWTDFGGDGDELGIALRTVDGTTGALGPLGHANSATAFSQYDPDILRVGSTVVVSWMDDADAVYGPDLEIRTFDTSLAPQGGQTALANYADAEGDVALAPFASSWAVAWRSASGGMETLHASAAGIEWTVGPILGGPADDKPALAELDPMHLLLVFTEGTDPLGTGIADVPRVRGAVLDTASPGDATPFDIDPPGLPYSGSLTVGQSQPNAARAGDHVYVSWRTAAVPGGAAAEQLWLGLVDWSAANAVVTIPSAIPLPRWPEHEPGDQRRPALAASLLPLGTSTALATAWEDYGGNFGAGEGNPDVIVELIPTPIVRSTFLGLDGGGQ